MAKKKVDNKLMKSIKDAHKDGSKKHKPKGKMKKKVAKVMTEFKEGRLHSGSKNGPEVTNPKQAVAIGYSEARKAEGKKIKKTMKKDKKK